MAMNSILRKFANVRRVGLRRFLRCRIDRQWLGLLALYFKFDPWHAEAPFSCRAYKQTVVDLVNGLAPGTVVEIGCGLGELLHRIEAPRKYGYDIDDGAIRAARFLYGKHIKFINGGGAQVDQESIDVLVLVNWIHALRPTQLSDLLAPLLSRSNYLVLDAIDPDGPGSYHYKHDFSFLEGKAERISITRPVDEPRSFHLFKVFR